MSPATFERFLDRMLFGVCGLLLGLYVSAVSDGIPPGLVDPSLEEMHAVYELDLREELATMRRDIAQESGVGK